MTFSQSHRKNTSLMTFFVEAMIAPYGQRFVFTGGKSMKFFKFTDELLDLVHHKCSDY